MALLILACILTACGGNTAVPEAARTPQPTGEEPAVNTSLSPALEETAQWLLTAVPEPCNSSVGGEWTVLGLARSGAQVPEDYYEGYYSRLMQTLQEKQGVLHSRKYTEYSRVILALTAIGKDPADAGGYDLLKPLASVEDTAFQGTNGPIYALLALDSGGYVIPGAESVRDAYVDFLLASESEGGGWSLAGGTAQTDITAMALQALAAYDGDDRVSGAIDRALELLSQRQNERGGFGGEEGACCESTAQVLTALCQLEISLEDSRFVKNGLTVKDALLEFRLEDGSFRHLMEGDGDLMATEQAFYALTALDRMEKGLSPLYTMEDR